ncbi:MAG: beta-ketoacyl synthase N-terminal-like domain-containing protein [Planctomycetota bacterium]
MQRHPVVITGVGVVSAIGTGGEAYFDALLQARSGVRSLGERTDGDLQPPPDLDPDGVWIGAPIIDFEPKQYVKPRKALKVMCREIQTAFASAQLACQHALLAKSIPASEDGKVKPDRLGVVFGSEIFFNPPAELIDPILACVDEQGELHPGNFGNAARRDVMPLWMLKYLPNMPACQVGISLNSRGPNNSLVLGDVSGPAALLEAESYLQRGAADVMVVGATGTRLAATRLLYRTDMPTAERAGHAIEDASRPHDPRSLGVVGGEAAASVVLESIDHVRQRNGRSLAEVVATASRFIASEAMAHERRSAEREPDSKRGSAPAIAAAIEAVLQEGDVSPGDVGAVVGHGIGDRQMDAAEAEALERCAITAPVVAIAASIGHTGAASGMMELATAALIAAHRFVPPSRGTDGNRRVNLKSEGQPLGSPYVLSVSHTSDGSALAVLLRVTD